MKRRTQITIERERLLLISRRKLSATGWCDPCGAQVDLLTPETAAAITGVGTRAIYRRVESGELHFTEIRDGLLLVCERSLIARPD